MSEKYPKEMYQEGIVEQLKKPREFWIETYITSHAIKPVNMERYTHVIEYSAYEQALEDCRIAGRETAAVEIRLEALSKERDELVQKMQEYKCAVAEMPQMDGGSPNEVAAQLLQYKQAIKERDDLKSWNEEQKGALNLVAKERDGYKTQLVNERDDYLSAQAEADQLREELKDWKETAQAFREESEHFRADLKLAVEALEQYSKDEFWAELWQHRERSIDNADGYFDTHPTTSEIAKEALAKLQNSGGAEG